MPIIVIAKTGENVITLLENVNVCQDGKVNSVKLRANRVLSVSIAHNIASVNMVDVDPVMVIVVALVVGQVSGVPKVRLTLLFEILSYKTRLISHQ